MINGLINSVRCTLLISLLWTLGCGLGKPPCKESFTKTIVPKEIHGKQELQFAIEDFAFLLDRNYVIEDIQLEGDIVQRHSRRGDFSFSLNGIKSARKDREDVLQLDCGKKNVDDKDKGRDRTDTRRFCTKAHKFFLNGGLSLIDFVTKIHKNKGHLKIKLHGRNHEIKNAKIVVKGTHYIRCSPPIDPPPPPPPPSKPTTSIQSIEPNLSPTAATTKTISFSADQSDVTFFCSLDAATATPCASPKSYAGLSSGAHVFKVYATNSAGLSDVVPASHLWMVDAVAPSVTIDNLASLKSNTSAQSVSFEFSSDDFNSTYFCAIDGNPSSECTSPKSYSALSEGSHKFSVFSVDSVGNMSPTPATFTWTIDISLPVVTIVAAAPAGPVNNASALSLQFSANESATFECAIDAGSFQVCASPQEFSGLNDGNHSIEVRATDLVGNLSLPASYSWRTDLIAPIISLGNIVPAPGLTSGQNVNVEFVLSEAANAKCSFDDAPAVACESPFQTLVNAQGNHNLVISAVDLAGNIAISQSIAWNMDFSLPEISFGAILPSSASFINSNNFSAEILISKPLTLSVKLNGVDLGSVSLPFTLNNLSEGLYTIEASGVDQVGNISNTIAHNFTVDMTAPSALLASQVGGVTRFDSNVLTFSSNDGSALQCNMDNMGFAACTSPLTLSGLAEGNHQFQVRPVDLAGNIGAVISADWSIDTVAPLTNLLVTQLSYDSMQFTLFSSELNSQFNCSLDGANPSPCSSPITYASLSPGSHTFTAWAIDAAGNVDPTGVSQSFIVRPPISTTLVSASPSAAFVQSTAMELVFTSNQPDASFVCSLNGAPATPCSSPMSYAELANGTFTFRVQAVDILGVMDLTGVSHAWTVDTVVPTMPTVNTTVTSTTIRVTWTTSEPTTTKLLWGKDFVTDRVVPEDNIYTTTHTVHLTGLSANSVYSLQPAGTDRAGNAFIANRFTARTSR